MKSTNQNEGEKLVADIKGSQKKRRFAKLADAWDLTKRALRFTRDFTTALAFTVVIVYCLDKAQYEQYHSLKQIAIVLACTVLITFAATAWAKVFRNYEVKE